MDAAPITWTDTYKVRVNETDRKARATPMAMLDFFQTSAWNHYSAVEKARGTLLEPDQIWVMSRMYVEFSAFPLWQEEIDMHTWARPMEKFLAYREFRAEKNGKLFCQGSVIWMVLDTKTNRPVRLAKIGSQWAGLIDERAASRDPEKIKENTDKKPDVYTPVKYFDIDVNGHVNNVKYLQRAMETYAPEFLDGRPLKTLDINFLNESSLGDSLGVVSAPLGNDNYLHSIFRKKDGTEVCRMKAIWEGVSEN